MQEASWVARVHMMSTRTLSHRRACTKFPRAEQYFDIFTRITRSRPIKSKNAAADSDRTVGDIAAKAGR